MVLYTYKTITKKKYINFFFFEKPKQNNKQIKQNNNLIKCLFNTFLFSGNKLFSVCTWLYSYTKWLFGSIGLKNNKLTDILPFFFLFFKKSQTNYKLLLKKDGLFVLRRTTTTTNWFVKFFFIILHIYHSRGLYNSIVFFLQNKTTNTQQTTLTKTFYTFLLTNTCY